MTKEQGWIIIIALMLMACPPSDDMGRKIIFGVMWIAISSRALVGLWEKDK